MLIFAWLTSQYGRFATRSITILTRATGPEPHRTRDFLLAAFIACAVAVNGAYAANQVLPMVEHWWFDVDV